VFGTTLASRIEQWRVWTLREEALSLTKTGDSLRLSAPGWPQEATGQDDGFAIAPSVEGMYKVRLWGRFSPGWCGSLSLGLSWVGVNIVRGFARKIAPGRWVAEFQVQQAVAGHDVTAIDYLALARDRPSSVAPVPIALDSYRIAGNAERSEALSLEVRGPDCVGFLGSLLECFARFSLFPEEMGIETREGQAVDRFALKATGGRTPSEEIRFALDALLDGLTRRPSLPGVAVNDAGL